MSDDHITNSEEITIIEPGAGNLLAKVAELWQHHELIYFLSLRDVKARYKQTLLGPAWGLIQPVVTMLVFSLVFGRLANIPSDGVPYPIFSFAGLVPWTYFSDALGGGGSSLISNSKLLTRIYFPRLILPLTSTLVPLVDFFASFVVLGLMMLWFGIIPSWRIVVLPFFLAFAFLTALSVSLWLSAINVVYRDVRYVIPFIRSTWLFLTPVAYPLSQVPEQLKLLYSLNPMTAVVEGFRWAILGTGELNPLTVGIGLSVVLVLFAFGIVFFNRTEAVFADLI